MIWRKWLVRGLVFTSLGSLALGAVLYQAWTNPEAVRRLVLEKLGVRFFHVNVSLESAHLRLLSGIAVHDLRMGRNDQLDRGNFLYVPAAVIYHDKEQLLGGELAIRKVELTRPELRLVRQRDGRFNVTGILGPVDLSERMPMLVIHQGTIRLEGPTLSPAGPVLEIKDVDLTVVNDPLPTLVVEGTGRTDVAGPVKISATLPRDTYAGHVHVQLTAVPVGPDLVQRLAGPCPELADHLRQLSGTATLDADLTYQPDGERPLHYDLTARLHDGTLAHARLPLPLTQLEVEARCVDGVFPHARLTARAGPARVAATLEGLEVPAPGAPFDFQRLVRKLDAKVEHLPVTPALLARLPEELSWIQQDYAPTGPVTVTHTYRRGPGRPQARHWQIAPEGMTATCSHFPYPIDSVTGTVDVETAGAPDRDIRIDLAGKAGGRPVRVCGTVRGPREASAVEVDVRGQDLLLDDRMFRALQKMDKAGNTARVAAQFLPEPSRLHGLAARPMGKADVHAALRRPLGQRQFQHVFTITFRDSAVQYDLFPYPLENVSGTLVLHRDHWECQGFQGSHAGGEVRVDGRSYASPPGADGQRSPPERVQLVIRGRGVPLDKEFGEALAPAGLPGRQALADAYHTLALAGRMDFRALVVDHPGQPQDLEVGVDIERCAMKPTFFDYALSDVSGSVRYAYGKVYLRDLRARHGGATLALPAGLLQLKPGGGFWAWLLPIRCHNLVPDEAFLKALPEPLRKGLAPLRLEGRLDVETELTLSASPGQGPLLVWWKGQAQLHDARFRAGVEASGAEGQVFCEGHHDGRQMRGVVGQLLLPRVRVLGQPLTNVSGRLEVRPEAPDVVGLSDLKADLFGGTLGGQARLEVGPQLRYEIYLKALGLRLEEIGRHNLDDKRRATAQLEGPIGGTLHLTGEGHDLLGLKGNGRVDVHGGKMGQLPLLLDLLKAFGLRMPDRTAFEEAHLLFAVEGPQVRVGQLELYGNAVSLHGQGTVDLDGNNVNLDFSATPGRLKWVLPEGVDLLPQALSQQILKIKARGKIAGSGPDDGVRFEKVLVPGVFEPITRAMGGS
jgi:hypothetical protein